MKNILLVLSFLMVSACETRPSRPAVEVRNYILDGASWRKDETITGFSAFVEMPEKTSEKDKVLFALLKSKTEGQLKTLGFKIVAKRAEANLWVDFEYSVNEFPHAFLEKNVDTTNGKITGSTSFSETFMNEGRAYKYHISSEDGPVGDLLMAVWAQDYGKRAKNLSYKRMRIPVNSPQFAESVEKVASEWIQDLNQAAGLVKESKQNGLPGCMPRFGFEAETILIENVPYKQVTSVPKKSPAAKAGLKVGDIILAIDSIPYMEFSSDPAKNRKVYEANVSVPIKFLRKTQEMRSNIKAAIMCD